MSRGKLEREKCKGLSPYYYGSFFRPYHEQSIRQGTWFICNCSLIHIKWNLINFIQLLGRCFVKPSARILALLKMNLWVILVISLTACASAPDDEPESISTCWSCTSGCQGISSDCVSGFDFQHDHFRQGTRLEFGFIDLFRINSWNDACLVRG